MIDSREEIRNLDFEILLRLDVVGNATVLSRKLIEQCCVDVVTNTKRKQPHARFCRAAYVSHDVGWISYADGGQSVRQEHKDLRPLSIHVRKLLQRCQQ